MSFPIHSIEPLPSPFVSVCERMAFVPPDPVQVHHRPDGVKFVFVVDGFTKRRIDDGPEFAVEPGDVLVYGRVCTQKVCGTRKDATKLRQWIIDTTVPRHPRDAAKAPDGGWHEESMTGFIRAHFPGFHHLRQAQSGLLPSLLAELQAEMDKFEIGKNLRVGAVCGGLVVELARLLGASSSGGTAGGNRPPSLIVEETREFLWKNLGRTLTLGEVAWQVRLSEQHLGRLFKRAMGQTVFEYLKRIRIERAKMLLPDPALTITRIATMTGFSSLALFSRTFKALAGQSPADYRANVIKTFQREE